MTKRPALLSLLFLATVATTACDTDLDAPMDETQEILHNLELAGWTVEGVEIDDDGRVIVGGDIHITLDASRELAGVEGAGEEGFRHYHSDNLVSDDLICIDASVYGNADKLDAIDGAIRRFNSQALSFWIERTDGVNQGSCDTVITVSEISGTGGSAGFPDNGHAYNKIKMGDKIWSKHGKSIFRHVFMHELGHTIGFRHNDWYDRSISCGSGGSEAKNPTGANHIPNTPTTGARNSSFMTACYTEKSKGDFNDADITALDELYGVGFCDAFDGRDIALRTSDDRWVRARGSDKNYRLDSRDDRNDTTTFTVDCTSGKVWLISDYGRYTAVNNSASDYLISQTPSWSSYHWLAPRKYQNGKWEFATRYARLMRAKNGNDNWKIKQSTSSQSDTRFELFFE